MKKIFVMMLCAFSLTSMISCNENCKKDKDCSNEALAYETMVVEENDDSLRMQFRFVIDFPVQGSDSLVNEIKKNIFFILGDSTLDDMSAGKLKTIAATYISDNSKEAEEMRSDFDRDFAASYSYDGSIKMVENTDRYVTYTADSYNYTGGAHGMPYRSYFTISKDNCRTLTLKDIIAEDKLDELKDLLKSYIVNQYYEGEAPAWGEVFKFDLPQQTPALTTKGVVFCYGAYEIDCYAAGMPFCTVPYEDIRDFMTDEAVSLIK